MDGLPERAHLWEHVRATQVSTATRSPQRPVTARQGAERRAAYGISPDVRFRHPHARLDRPILRRVVEINDGRTHVLGAFAGDAHAQTSSSRR